MDPQGLLLSIGVTLTCGWCRRLRLREDRTLDASTQSSGSQLSWGRSKHTAAGLEPGGQRVCTDKCMCTFFLQRLMVMLSNRCEDRNGAALTVEAVIVSLSTMRTTASGLQDLSALATREVGPREHARGSRWMSFFLLNQGLQLTLLLSPFLELLLLMRI